MKIKPDLPIGIFDSGLGGLTVVKEISRLLPGEKLIYVGDTARVPYGTKSPDTIRRYALQIGFFLLRKPVKAIVVACNSASAAALGALKRFPVPVIGVIEPGARAAVRSTKKKSVAVIGTQATVNSGAYVKAIQRREKGVKVFQKACPLFVPLVEEGRVSGPIARLAAKEYLKSVKGKGVDSLVLGCTHYPLLKPVLSREMGKNVTLIDSAKETAKEVRDILGHLGWLRKSKKRMAPEIFTTDDPEAFAHLGRRFLGTKRGRARRLNLDGL